jgi:hypothetical protein
VTETNALQTIEGSAPLTGAQLKARLAVIQDVMRAVMQQDVDYGVIPGTQKPTLYKPGAEKLCVTFRLSADHPQVEQVPDYSGDIRYRINVPIKAADGTVLAVGVGECSTGEEKYRWRRPVHIKEFEAADPDRKREKWQRNGQVWQQVRVEPADVANTVLKMAHKRAYIHGVIMATAAGSIFTQDIEDRPEGMEGAEDEPRRQPPQARGQATANGHTNGNGPKYISEAQVKRLHAIRNERRIAENDLRDYVARFFPYTVDEMGKAHMARIAPKDYDDIIDAIEAGLGKHVQEEVAPHD